MYFTRFFFSPPKIHPSVVEENAKYLRPVRLAYQPPANSTFLSEQTSHHQPANSTFLSEQTSTSHQPPAERTGCWYVHAAPHLKKFNHTVVVRN
jgi:hypothetical protein